MSKVTIPQGYHAPLSVYELQRAIEFIKSNFQTNLSNALNLRRVSAPLFVEEVPTDSKIVRRAVWPAVTAQPDIALHGRHRPLVLQLTASALFGLFRSKPLIQNMMYYRPFELMTN